MQFVKFLSCIRAPTDWGWLDAGNPDPALAGAPQAACRAGTLPRAAFAFVAVCFAFLHFRVEATAFLPFFLGIWLTSYFETI